MIDRLRTIRERLKYSPAKFLNSHSEGDKKDIFIFTSPRSGSTWLMELIASQDNIKFVNEPLHINRHKGLLTDITPDWSEIYSKKNRKEKFMNYFSRILNEELYVGQQKLKELFNGEFKFITNRRVFKILRAKDLINYFEDEFQIQVVYLLRHPIAVGLSLAERGFEERVEYFLNNKEYIDQFLNDDLVEFSKFILANGSKFEIKILQWCLENLPPLKFLDNKEWLIISYEEMVIEEENTLDKLYKELELESLDKLYRQVGIPSRTTSNDQAEKILNKSDKENIIKKWTKKISKEEEEKAFIILDKFNIDIYQRAKFTINSKSDFFNN
ncbi:sulfotransferase [Orenia marismortui]|uniref:sulfotransferase n=1 Tax=Orenia marismortui TaxID=46469 RepID=UPI00036B9BE0|nr:sulfotransferase [Orenia marismortui]